VACADHCRHGAFALPRIGGLSGIRTDRSPAGKTKRGLDRFGLGQFTRVARFLLGDAGHRQRLTHPPLAKTAPAQRPRFRQRIGAIIDVTELDQPIGEPVQRRIAIPIPAPLAQLALEIDDQLGLAGGEAADIAQRELIQRTTPVVIGRTSRRTGTRSVWNASTSLCPAV